MDPLQLLRLAIDQTSEINTYWNFYIAVAGTVLGIMASGKTFTNSKGLKLILTFAFVVFAISNANAIIGTSQLRSVLTEIIPMDFPEYNKLKGSLNLVPWFGYLAFHVFMDFAVIACIWIVRWPELKSK